MKIQCTLIVQPSFSYQHVRYLLTRNWMQAGMTPTIRHPSPEPHPVANVPVISRWWTAPLAAFHRTISCRRMPSYRAITVMMGKLKERMGIIQFFTQYPYTYAHFSMTSQNKIKALTAYEYELFSSRRKKMQLSRKFSKSTLLMTSCSLAQMPFDTGTVYLAYQFFFTNSYGNSVTVFFPKF